MHGFRIPLGVLDRIPQRMKMNYYNTFNCLVLLLNKSLFISGFDPKLLLVFLLGLTLFFCGDLLSR